MEEPNVFVRWAIFFFAGGDAGILGALSISVIVMLGALRINVWKNRPLFLGGVATISAIFVACGSTPVPTWFQLSTVLWLAFLLWERTSRRLPSLSEPKSLESSNTPPLRLVALLGSFVWVLTAFSIELPIHFWSKPAESVSDVLVIGDSVTAGLNDGEDTWPRQLSRDKEVRVFDASQPGATLQSARQQNARFSQRAGLVIIEIGGNDMLEGLPVARFEENLDHLLNDISQPGRFVMMFELPLPPFHAKYGSAQRRQAKQHKVSLIPKRRFARVLTTSGSTVDGIHLSAQGQSQMRILIESLLGDRLRSGTGSYEHFERVSNSEPAVSTSTEE